MRCLLYCIYRDSAADGETLCHNSDTLAGIGGQPVFQVSNRGLCAAVSEIVPLSKEGTCSISAPEISHLLDFEKIVKSFLRNRTVIPMRYGCLFDEESHVSRLLEERHRHYLEMLMELEGCVEMGIRALMPDLGTQSPDSETSNPQTATFTRNTSGPGREYLNARLAHYAREVRFARENSLLADRCRTEFDGLFVKCKSEYPSFQVGQSLIRNPLFSLYFLVPRGSIESFRLVFRQFRSKESAKLMLSGPWPPYNFVTPFVRAEPDSRRI